jgi:hypothetical protein
VVRGRVIVAVIMIVVVVLVVSRLVAAIMIVVIVLVVGQRLRMLVVMLVRPEMEVGVVDDLTADHVLVAEGDVLQPRRDQAGQSEQNPHRPDENGGASTAGPVAARRLDRWSCA